MDINVLMGQSQKSREFSVPAKAFCNIRHLLTIPLKAKIEVSHVFI